MKKLLILILLTQSMSLCAQKDNNFWFTAPAIEQVNSNSHDRPILLRLSSFSAAATITVSMPADPSFVPIIRSIGPNTTSSIDLSPWLSQVENTIANAVTNKGILIQSTTEITAYYEVSTLCNCNPELFALKGKNALGTEFIIPSQTEWPIDTIRMPGARAAFNIVATENSTVVNITPSKQLIGRLPGIAFSILLNKGQTFSNQSLYRSGNSLLNGSIVTSSKPIAVTADDDMLMADGPCADLAGDQLIPTAIWGSQFVVVRGDLTNKDKVVISAMTNGTNIYLDGNPTAVATINRGGSYEFNLVQATSYITSNNKISVYHYTGVNCEIGSAVIPKINCTGSSDVAITRSIDEDAVVFITTKAGNQAGFLVNGNPSIITGADFLPVPGSGGQYVYCKKKLNSSMPTGSPTRFINGLGNFQLGFLNGATPFSYSGCRYGFFSDFKSSSVERSQMEICPRDSAQLNAFGGISYEWSPATGLNSTNIATPKASPAVTTDYKVIITTSEGCIDSAFIKVVVSSNCQPNAIDCNSWLSTPSAPSYVNVGDLDVTGNKMTIEATFNRTTPYTGGNLYAGNLVSKHNHPTTVNYLLRPNSAEITTTNGYFITPGVCDIQLNKTYHVAMVYDGSTLKFYRNGFLMSQVAVTGNLYQNDLQTRIGWLDFTPLNENFIGYINEVRIWNVARSQAEIRTFMNSTIPNPTGQAGLLGYYNFDNLLNKQGNALFNGTLAGSASINQTNPGCNFTIDSCAVSVPDSIIINDYTPVLALDICKNNITVENAARYNVGDTVLMIQMKGAIIDSSNTPVFGTITDYKNAGNYEFNYVESKSGNVILLKNKLIRQYDIPLGKVQLVRVPYYYNANFNSVITCLPWDGNKGGVLAFNVRDTLTLNANIDVGARGFRGGRPVSNANYICDVDSFFVVNNNGAYAAAKGEGISNSSRLYARGKMANGGGGGNSTNAGGAGGGNAGNGGNGGKQYLPQSGSCSQNFTNGGIGGLKLDYSNPSNKIFLGGGGGAGHDNESLTTPAGNGGGIAIISAGYFLPNSNTIISTGATPNNIDGLNEDGRSGGGAGGTVLLNYSALLQPLGINVRGGNGDFSTATMPLVNLHGPGGGGGGGIVWINKPLFEASLTTNIAGGINGTNINLGNDPWGSTPGANGMLLNNLALPVTNILFKPNIDSVRFTTDPVSCTSYDFVGFGYTNTYPVASWNWSFGDGGTATTQTASHAYANAGTYPVKLIVTDINGCKDSISRTVTPSGSDADFGYQQDVCNPLSIRFFSIGNNSPNAYWSFGDGNTTSGTNTPTHVYGQAGNYLVKYFVAGSCADTVSKNISVNILWDDMIITPDTTVCFNSTKQLRTQPALSFCWSPTTFLNDPLSPNPVTSTPGPITYYFTSQTEGTNLVTNGNFNGGNSGFTSEYNYTANNITEGQYFVGPNPQAWNNALSPCTDHTNGNSNMLLVNGSPIPDVTVWTQAVPVTANTNYAFSTWIQALYPPNPANLAFSINGFAIGNPITATLPTCSWSRFYTTWNSGNSTTAIISIVNKNTFVQGNDFALEDISFAPVFIRRDSVKIRIDTPIVKTIADSATCIGTPIQLSSTGAVQYNWTPSAGLSATSGSNPAATPAVTTQYIVTGTNGNGCMAKDSVTVTVKPLPIISISPMDTICVNQSVQISAAGGIAYAWSPAATLNNPAIPNPVATPAGTTLYTVTVTGGNNCTNKDSVKISIKALPAFAVSPGVATCINGKAQLAASGGTTYLWSPANLLNNAGIANPVATVSGNTMFQVIIRDADCNLSDTLFTTVTTDLVPPPVTATKSNDMDCVFSSVQLNATGADTYTWTPATDLSNTTIPNPVATPSVTRQYRVVGTNSVSNCSSIDTITVFVRAPAAPKAYIPNAFSPNGDGTNDCFRVNDFGTVKTVEIIIYNRFGNLVFQTKNPLDCWDGTYKGTPSEPGNYVYFIKVINDCGEEIKKGNLVLLR